MDYLFKVEKGILNNRPNLKLFAGIIGTYTFSFDFDEHWQGLFKFASFTKDSDTYIVSLENDTAKVPSEILEKPGLCSFGVYGTNGENNIKRISSNILEFEVIESAYSKWQLPTTPTPDVWEALFKNSIPKIVNDYWHLYNITESKYVNTGIKAVADKPIKNVDYFTDEDKIEFVDMVEKKAIGEIEVALDLIVEIQNTLIGGESL